VADVAALVEALTAAFGDPPPAASGAREEAARAVSVECPECPVRTSWPSSTAA
jgi:hypothetical protein